MRHCILASHHRFAEGLRDTLEFIGGVQGIDVICQTRQAMCLMNVYQVEEGG